MKDLVILRYTDEIALDTLYNFFTNLKKAMPTKTVIAVPYSIDILDNYSLEQLYEIRKIIDEAIKEMEKKE